ncbi:universal stress protein [Chryseolinea sp. H1M3-3]|uniref:universal stress protein n=1 Tax=Chryseolinea sp. H1M3-3 TaxID=3034144 RepID=UPI0023EDD2E2|nr:universal stress protein [Chryseolinea sp. H1M3-3]
MLNVIKKIGVAIAFSPRIEAILAEAIRIKNMWNAELILIHVGVHGEKETARLNELLSKTGLGNAGDVKIFWEEGKPSHRILATCKKENVDLLIAGALKKENLVQYYLGTVARKIIRKADCSVLLLTNPSTTPQPFKNIVVDADDRPYVEQSLQAACEVALKDQSTWLHIVRELKMYGLTMAAAEQCTEEEYEEMRHQLVQSEIETVEKILQKIPHQGLKVNIKLVSGKSGFELAQFAKRKQADLLVVGAPDRRFSFFDRVFTHDQEYIFADLPCNLLIIHPRKEVVNG